MEHLIKKPQLVRLPSRVRQLNLKEQTEDEYEICVLCGKKTNVKRSTHIDLRDCYVEGCGQFCPQCWNSTYRGGGGSV